MMPPKEEPAPRTDARPIVKVAEAIDMNRNQRRHAEKLERDKVYQRALIENKILRDSLEKVNKTAQTAVLALTELARGKIEVSRIDANAAAVLVFRVEDGNDLTDEFCDQMMRLLKLPLVVLPKSTTFEAVDDKVLENAGWTRKVEIVRAEGQALPE